MTGYNPPQGYVARRLQQEREKLSQNLAQRILESVNKPYVGDQTLKWLKSINEDVGPSVSPGQQMESSASGLTNVSILDKLFNDFDRYSFHFNQTETDRDYVTTCVRPAASSLQEARQKYMGCLHNSIWAIVLNSSEQAICGTVLPARFAYEDISRWPATKPLFEMVARPSHGTLIWHMNGRSIGVADLQALSKKIFARLTRVSRHQVAPEASLFEEKIEEQPAAAGSEFALIPDNAPELSVDAVSHMLIGLLGSIDDHMEDLTKEAMRYLQIKDFQKLTSINGEMQSLKAFRAKAADLATEWANSIHRAPEA